MSRSILVIFSSVCALTASSMDVDQAKQLSAQAQEAYIQGDPARALGLYDSVLVEFTSAALLYNAGNCHFKLNDISHAILYYERALLLEPGSDDIKANLELAKQRTVDRVRQIAAFQLGSSWERFWGGPDVDSWARRSLWAWSGCILLLAIGVQLRRTAWRTVSFTLSGLCAIVTLTAVLLSNRRVSNITDNGSAIVMASRVEVVSEPRPGSTDLFLLHAGTKVSIRKDQGEWLEVGLQNTPSGDASNTVGWVSKSAVEPI